MPSAFSQSASLAAGVPLVGCCAGLDASGRVVSTKEAPPAAEVVAARGEGSAVSAARLPSLTDGPRGLGSAAPGHLAARHAAASAQRRRRQCEGVGALRNGERCAKRKPAAGGSPLGGVSPQAGGSRGPRNNANLGDLCIPTRTRVAPLGIGCMFAVFRLSTREDTYSPHSVGSTRCRRSPLALTRLLRIHGAR